MKKYLISFFIIFLFFNSNFSKTEINGSDFFNESGSLSTINIFHNNKINIIEKFNNNQFNFDLFNIDFSLENKSSFATFLVRSVDKYGRPLLGDSADGKIDGLCYKTILSSFISGRDKDYLFIFPLIIEYFAVTSEKTPFLTLFNFDQSKTFGANAYQFFTGFSYIHPKSQSEINVGFIVKYRDSIDVNNKFISRTIGYNYPADYLPEETNSIPKGKGEFFYIEPYFDLTYYGYNLKSIINFDIGLFAFAQLSKIFDLKQFFGIFLTEFEPIIKYINSFYNYFDNITMWCLPFNLTILDIKFLKLYNYFDYSIWPLRFNENRTFLDISISPIKLGGAFGIQNKNNQIIFGYKTYISFNYYVNIELSISYNYAGNMIGGIPIKDDFLYSILIKL